jgi:hypothetical protein
MVPAGRWSLRSGDMSTGMLVLVIITSATAILMVRDVLHDMSGE